MFLYLGMVDTPEEKAKFEKVYRKYAGMMYHIAFEILQSQQDAEDAVQLAFLNIAANIGKIENPLSPKAKGFVVTITQNKAIDLYRMRKRREEIQFNDRVKYSSEPIDESIETKFYLLQLPPEYKQVLVLKHVYGFTNKEIAQTMNISQFSAVQLEQRARKKFVELYEEGARL